MRRYCYLLCCLLCVWQVAWAENTVFSVPLQHRPAEQLLPLIQPVVPKDVHVTGKGMQLVISAPPASARQIQQLIQQLDKPLKMFLIQVQRADAYSSLNRDDVDVWETENWRDQKAIQRVRGLEGQAVFVSTGQQVPVLRTTSFGFHHAREGIDYEDVSTGFYVTPHWAAGKVLLDVTYFMKQAGRVSPIEFETAELQTQVRVPLDTWVPLSDMRDSSQQHEDSQYYHSHAQDTASRSLYIHITLLPAVP